VRDYATPRFGCTLPKNLPKLRFLRGFQLRERLLNFELLHCISDIPLIHNRVPLENAPRFPATDFLNHTLGYSGTSQIPGSRPSEIMKQQAHVLEFSERTFLPTARTIPRRRNNLPAASAKAPSNTGRTAGIAPCSAEIAAVRWVEGGAFKNSAPRFRPPIKMMRYRGRKADGGKCEGGPLGTLYNRR
jgi:hypothetical protein